MHGARYDLSCARERALRRPKSWCGVATIETTDSHHCSARPGLVFTMMILDSNPFLREFLAYFGPLGFAHVGVGVLLTIVFQSQRHSPRFRLLFLLLALNGSLLLFGSLAHAVWSTFVHGHLYYVPDYTIGFTPFWPITEYTLSRDVAGRAGELLQGTTLLELQVVWLGFAAGTWLLALGTAALVNPLFARLGIGEPSKWSSPPW